MGTAGPTGAASDSHSFLQVDDDQGRAHASIRLQHVPAQVNICAALPLGFICTALASPPHAKRIACAAARLSFHRFASQVRPRR